MESVLIFILTFVAVAALGSAVMLYLSFRQRRIKSRLMAVEDKLDLGHVEHTTPWTLKLISVLGRAISMGPTSQALHEKLGRAGFHSKLAPHIFLGTKILLLIIALPITPLLMEYTTISGSVSLLIGLLVLFGLFFLPNMVLHSRQKARRLNIQQHLPDAVDLLEVCVSAGIGLDMAWNMVSDEVYRVCPMLADEMALTNLEIHLGSSQTVAMRNLSDRTGVEEIGRLVAVLVQSERFGTSVSEALRVFAASMRERRSMQAEEGAEKMAVAMLLPMILFIFPAVFIVTVGPASITLMKILSQH